MLLGDTGLVEEGDEGLVGGLDQHELERVAIESNAFEGGKDGVQKSAPSDWNSHQTPCEQFFGGSYLLLPIPLMSSSPKTPASWKLAKWRACSTKVGGRR